MATANRDRDVQLVGKLRINATRNTPLVCYQSVLLSPLAPNRNHHEMQPQMQDLHKIRAERRRHVI
jgi:hypothetical protein